MNDEAKQRALKILDRRDVSRKMLLDKLTEKGISNTDAEEVADWLCGLGVVNDERFAGLVVRHYAAKGYGVRKIQDEFFKRRVPRDCWGQALEQLEAPDETIDRLIEKKLRGKEVDRKELNRVSAFLARRGFSWNDIREGLARYGASLEEP